MNEAQPAPETPTPEPRAADLIREAYPAREKTVGEQKAAEIDEAVQEIKARREVAPPHMTVTDLEIGYKQPDGVTYDSKKEVSAREATNDLHAWRERARANVLAELGEAEAAAVEQAQQQQTPTEQPAPEQPAADPGITRDGWISGVTSDINDALARGENAEQIKTRVTQHADQLLSSAQSAYRQQEAVLARAVQAQNAEALMAASQYKNAAEGIAQTILQMCERELPGVRTPEDVAKLPPEKQQRFTELDDAYRAAKGEAHATHQAVAAAQAQIQAQEAQARQAAFRQYVAQEEAKVAKLIPELDEKADPTARRELQQAAQVLLRGVGYTDDEMRSAWYEGAPLSLRDARAQAVIAKAAKYDRLVSRENELRAHRKPIPPVQRPGVGGQRISRADAEIQKLESKGELSIKEATALMRARRSARA